MTGKYLSPGSIIVNMDRHGPLKYPSTPSTEFCYPSESAKALISFEILLSSLKHTREQIFPVSRVDDPEAIILDCFMLDHDVGNTSHYVFKRRGQPRVVTSKSHSTRPKI